jgi:succinate dehydrogenase / fumarate reductase, membrane anchor subunit
MSSDRTSPLAAARGLGSAGHGVGHWWAQRLTALALIPLGLWFVSALVCLAGADHAAIAGWMAEPISLVGLILFVLAIVYHAVLGVQVVIEDYVHAKSVKLTLVILLQLGGFALAAGMLVALFRIALNT